jgi:hypothetical protein
MAGLFKGAAEPSGFYRYQRKDLKTWE